MQQANDMLATASAVETAAAVRTGTISALETTEAAIARIEALDGPINAVVVRECDRARDQAKQVDAAMATGAHLPLAGAPLMVKAKIPRPRLSSLSTKFPCISRCGGGYECNGC